MKSFGLRGDFGESRLLSDVRILKQRFLPLRHKTSKDPTSSVGLEFFLAIRIQQHSFLDILVAFYSLPCTVNFFYLGTALMVVVDQACSHGRKIGHCQAP